MSTYRILVFGTTGVGKTSLCNTLTGKHQEVSSAACGTTFETYTYDPFSIDGDTFYITDTVGLNGSKLDRLSAEKAAEELMKLLQQAQDGFNILIHVFKGKRDILHDNNYDFFVKGLTKESIPTLLVATGCENEHPMSAWADKNQEYLKLDCKYQEVIATCFAEGVRPEVEALFYAPLRMESRQQLLTAIIRHALSEPIRIDTMEIGGIGGIFIKLLKRFIDLEGVPKHLRTGLNKFAYILMVKYGIPESIAGGITEPDGILDKVIDAVADGAKNSFNYASARAKAWF